MTNAPRRDCYRCDRPRSVDARPGSRAPLCSDCREVESTSMVECLRGRRDLERLDARVRYV